MFLTPGSRARPRKRASVPGSPLNSVQFNNAGAFGGFGNWNGVQFLSLLNLTNQQSILVYNTTDSNTSPTNYERGVFDWTIQGGNNILTIGTQKGGSGTARDMALAPAAAIQFSPGSGNNSNPSAAMMLTSTTLGFAKNVGLTFCNTNNLPGSAIDTQFWREAAGILQINNAGSPSGFRVYNTTDSPGAGATPTNYERGVFDWNVTGNVLTIGMQHGGTGLARQINFAGASQYNFDTTIQGTNFNGQFSGNTAVAVANSGPAGFKTVNNGAIGFSSGASAFNALDTAMMRDAGAGLLALASNNNTNAVSLRVYNTTDQFASNVAPTNYERGVFDWATTANVLTVGPQAGGTGVLRTMVLVGPPVQVAGQTRLAADFSVASSTAMTTSTAAALSVALQINRNYSFQACLISTCSTSGGVQFTVNSTTISGSTDLRWTGYTVSQSILASQIVSTAFGGLIGPLLPSTTTVVTYIDGTITNTASSGNLQIWFAQDVSTSVASVIKKGSYLFVEDMA